MRYIKINAESNGSHLNQNGGFIDEEGWAIIPENMCIPSNFPFVNIIVENGVVISMTNGVLPPVDITVLQNKKIKQMSEQCRSVIISGIIFNDERYSLEIEDQLNLMSLIEDVKNGATQVPYHANGENCRFYTAQEFTELVDACTRYKIYHESYYNSLRNYINNLTTEEEINNIFYGINIPEEYQTEVLKALLSE